MHILLKNILKEIEEANPVKYQFYCDMDGVLVDMEKGFKAISGGLSPKDYEAKNGENSFWPLINKHPNFWIDLEPLPDAKILWDYIKDNFKNPPPVILSAGNVQKNPTIKTQKEAWIRKHIDPNVRVILAMSGELKPQNIINGGDIGIVHILLDDTEKNIIAWENSGQKNRIGIKHKNAADSINLIKDIITT